MIKDVYDTSPLDIKPGDVFVVTVAFHVQYYDNAHHLRVCAYRCPWPDPQLGTDGVPQGAQIDSRDLTVLMRHLVPVLMDAEAKADPI